MKDTFIRKVEFPPDFVTIIKSLRKKDMPSYEKIIKKIEEIRRIKNLDHYKNLKHGLKKYKRVHISHYVLVFKINKDGSIRLEDFDHHDNIYIKKRK